MSLPASLNYRTQPKGQQELGKKFHILAVDLDKSLPRCQHKEAGMQALAQARIHFSKSQLSSGVVKPERTGLIRCVLAALTIGALIGIAVQA